MEVFDVFVELKKFRRYQIVMTSYNIIGESPPSSPVEVLVGEAGRLKLKEGDSLVAFPTSSEHVYYYESTSWIQCQKQQFYCSVL